MNTKVLATFECATVGDLLERLTAISKDKALRGVLDAAIDSTACGDYYTKFRVVERVLGDGSVVLDFVLVEDTEDAEKGGA